MSQARPAPADVLVRLGHTAAAADLVALCGRARLRKAVDGGEIVRVAPATTHSPTCRTHD
jgi:hypothetical protein